jgi:hypothetical protein
VVEIFHDQELSDGCWPGYMRYGAKAANLAARRDMGWEVVSCDSFRGPSSWFLIHPQEVSELRASQRTACSVQSSIAAQFCSIPEDVSSRQVGEL